MKTYVQEIKNQRYLLASSEAQIMVLYSVSLRPVIKKNDGKKISF